MVEIEAERRFQCAQAFARVLSSRPSFLPLRGGVAPVSDVLAQPLGPPASLSESDSDADRDPAALGLHPDAQAPRQARRRQRDAQARHGTIDQFLPWPEPLDHLRIERRNTLRHGFTLQPPSNVVETLRADMRCPGAQY